MISYLAYHNIYMIKSIYLQTELLIMVNQIADVVHIIPLGHEIERATRPFDTALANRVYLIVDTGAGSSEGLSERDKRMNGEQRTIYTPAVQKALEEKNIEVRIVETTTFNLEILLRAITSIIRFEQKLGNNIQINMSSSGRLGAVAAYMAGMVYNVPTYYVHSDHFSHDSERKTKGLSSCSENEVSYLTLFSYTRPTDTEALILEYLQKNGESFSKEIIDYLILKEVGEFADKDGDSERNKRDVDSRKFMRLATVMRKLSSNDKFVEVRKDGRKMLYGITDLGIHALSLCGIDAEKYAEKYAQ